MISTVKSFLKKFFSRECIYCGKCVDGKDDVFCKSCEKRIMPAAHTDNIICAISFDSAQARKLILTMKDYKLQSVYAYAADLVAQKLLEQNIPDLSEYYITFAPRNLRSLFKMRFDQSYEVGKQLSKKLFGTRKRCKIIFASSLRSMEQKSLNSVERMENVRTNLRIIPHIKVPEKLIILDDITTTGSTLFTLRDIAMNNGAKSCILCAVAKQKNI